NWRPPSGHWRNSTPDPPGAPDQPARPAVCFLPVRRSQAVSVVPASPWIASAETVISSAEEDSPPNARRASSVKGVPVEDLAAWPVAADLFTARRVACVGGKGATAGAGPATIGVPVATAATGE